MFFKTTILVLLMLQWKFLVITAEGQDIDSKLTELSNDIKQLAKQFEKNAQNKTEDTMLELRGEENFQLSILTGQQRALENKMDIVRNNQDDLNQTLSQLRQNQDEIKQGQSQMKMTQEEIKQALNQMKLFKDEMKRELSQIKLTQHKDNNTTNSIVTAIKKLPCDLPLAGLKTQIFNHKRYYVSHDQPIMSWSEADKFCKSHGMDLVSVETQQEWDALKPEAWKLYSKIGPPWSSGSDAAQEGKWKWTSTGTDVTFLAGLYYMANTTIRNCLVLHTTGWGDHPCSYKLPFICEQNTLC